MIHEPEAPRRDPLRFFSALDASPLTLVILGLYLLTWCAIWTVLLHEVSR